MTEKRVQTNKQKLMKETSKEKTTVKQKKTFVLYFRTEKKESTCIDHRH